jgi:osmotically-inducible protein OsmY
MSMSDEDIDKQIIDELYWDNSVNAAEVAVTVEDGVVTLEGTVPSYRAKVTATDDAYDVSGVIFVDNRLNVKDPKPPADTLIESNITNALSWDFDLDSQKIRVTVNKGDVKLLGTVDAYWKKMVAEADASKVRGVMNIKNEIAIVPTNEREDEQIAKDVEEALRRKWLVNVNDVDVTVEHGNVTLTGDVPTRLARTEADDAAFYTNGVRTVENKLAIV